MTWTSKQVATVATLLLVACVFHVPAQEIMGDAVFCMGTTTLDTHGRDWAYVLWQTTDHTLVMGKKFAVYAKDGDADSSSLYQRKAIAVMQTDPLTIQALLNRAVLLGDDLAKLEERIDSLFLSILPHGALTLADKISAIIRGSVDDSQHFGNLVLLGRLHPGINLCIGYAHAGQIGSAGKTTFEIREFDVANGTDIGVVGRVTVEAGAPVVIPAPGAPVQVPEDDPRGDLNVKLRWATDAPLRRLSLLSYGFNLYRMSKSFADGNGFDLTPPDTTTLVDLAAADPEVRRVNRLPILKSKDFDAANVADFSADPTTYFVADDNERYKAGGTAFRDGDQYYYYVTAIDVLLRDGLVSGGALVTICDRLGPDAPRGLEVVNDYSYDYQTQTNTQVLKVTWEQHSDTNQDTVVNYYVYRWTNLGHVTKFAADPLMNRIAGPIPHLPGESHNRYVDDAPGSPQMPDDQGRTFWYTVRSEDDSACGGNLSPNSAPSFGVLRDRVGPERPDGSIYIRCCLPAVTPHIPTLTSDPNPQNPDLAYYELSCARPNPAIAWAEFYAVSTGDPTNQIGQFHFAPGTTNLSTIWTVDRSLLSGSTPFYCRAGMPGGKVSAFVVVPTFDPPAPGFIRQLSFSAAVDCQTTLFSGTNDDLCRTHYGQPPGGQVNVTAGIEVTIDLTAGTKEYKLYRRVDFGPLTLIAQGEADFNDVTQITITNTPPANSGILCYYGQLFDEHGNPSPITKISGICVPFVVLSPTPLLSPISPEGNLTSPFMRIRWFCAPAGVQRFQVWIAGEGLATMPTSISSELSPRIGPMQANVPVVVAGITNTYDFGVYETSRIGPSFGVGAGFSIRAEIQLGVNYIVFIKPVGSDGSPADDTHNSNAEDFVWTETVPVGPEIPWPARPLPPIAATTYPTPPAAVLLTNDLVEIGIRIGSAHTPTSPGNTRPYYLSGQTDPLTHLYGNRAGNLIFPLVAYRYQEANSAFPTVSGTLIQVSPLMEAIAHVMTNHPSYGPVTAIYDPFIRVEREGDTQTGTLHLLDTQPALIGARYVYLLVRMNAYGEIVEVIPTPPLEVTP